METYDGPSDEARWNHNIHYHRVLLDEIPADARRALDVGCGEGLLTRRLRRLVPDVVGIDPDETSLGLARRHPGGEGVTYLPGGLQSEALEPGSFDVVTAVAVLHHMDVASGLARMRELLRPGGVLGVIGLARAGLVDLPYVCAAAAASRLQRLGRGWYEPVSPIQPPSETFAAVRRIVFEELPGARWRRRLLWRYTVLWRKPAA